MDEKPRIDFYATYKPRRFIDAVSWLFTFSAIVIIVSCIIIGWRFGTYLHEHGIYLL